MARFVQTVNGVVVGRYDLLPQQWESHNLRSMSKEQLKSIGWYHVVVEEPLGWDGNTHRIVGPDFTIRDDDVLEKYTLVALSAEEIAANEAARQQAEAQMQAEVALSVTQEQMTSNPEIAELVNRLKSLTQG